MTGQELYYLFAQACVQYNSRPFSWDEIESDHMIWDRAAVLATEKVLDDARMVGVTL
jgi:hypothetical protein